VQQSGDAGVYDAVTIWQIQPEHKEVAVATFEVLVQRMTQRAKDEMLCVVVYELARGGCDDEAALVAKIDVLVQAGAVFAPAGNPFAEWREASQPTLTREIAAECAA
jgi:hypothetical protein